MNRKRLVIFSTFMVLLFAQCTRKTHPEKSSANSGEGNNKKTGPSKMASSVKPLRTPVPKVIIVNDNIATKTFDGRLYYDLEGHRYWRSKKDGKYYLYNKSMNTDPAFKWR